jgi:hypothetical protein
VVLAQCAVVIHTLLVLLLQGAGAQISRARQGLPFGLELDQTREQGQRLVKQSLTALL